MIETVEQLKEERPDLLELWKNMSREELLEEIYKESLDAINMEERVQIFMNDITGLSYTTYTPDVIRNLIQKAFITDRSHFCMMVLEDIEGMDIQEIKEYLREEIK